MPVDALRFSRSAQVLGVYVMAVVLGIPATVAAQTPKDDVQSIADFIQSHCVDCHSGADAERGFALDSFASLTAETPRRDWDTLAWEKILSRIASGQMPPPDSDRPSQAEYEDVITVMERHLQRQADAFPDPGNPDAIRRLTRREYQNAIRDLLSLPIDASQLLPADPSSDGFDNITVGELSPTLLERYIVAAQKISRLAVGTRLDAPDGVIIRLPADQTQEHHVDGLPLGTRGGTLVQHHFPNPGEYEIQVRLMRDRDEKVEGLSESHDLDILIDRKRVHRFTLKPPRGNDHTHVDTALNARFTVSEGPHWVGVTFPQQHSSLLEIKRQPFDASYNQHRHPRRSPAISEISIVGPFEENDTELVKEAEQRSSPSRAAIFTRYPAVASDARACAEDIVRHLTRRAYRRAVTQDDLVVPMQFFDETFRANSANASSASASSASASSANTDWRARFESGIQVALSSILVNPHFLFRIEREHERDNEEDGSQLAHPISNFELASRLSFFLWSSLPDDELLDLAEQGELHRPERLNQQVMRMLTDSRSDALIHDFADQWLYLRNLPTITPDLRLFPDFDNNLRDAFGEETRQLFADVVRRDASVLELIHCDHTFLNQRLAKHYGISGVTGSHFRRVDLPPDSHRGGLLRHGSILMATSYATRTSPTIRGNWVLENILGTPPPPPPPNVPALKEKTAGVALSVRERLQQHRADPACASCHDLIDPVGFALDQYDAIGRWRYLEGDVKVDSLGRLPDGLAVDGIDELEAGILRRPEMFVGTMVRKLMTFGLGRPIRHQDGPAVRQIVDAAAKDDFRFSSIVSAIVSSQPFLMRSTQ
ncbi:DUF1592 domain-containing protein [Stieleria varia]|uniref:Planctomycete cytochrome C n=1 Tax=Stieleria varia TaxID=2528005 RepID=A0A5C6AT61_9BACT|nr:DUF1592 domain-containing protein [Stieleria varia]TWU02617.1 Planctomycete cytochrome C [Stieleria varia]